MLKHIGFGLANCFDYIVPMTVFYNKGDVPDPARMDEAKPECAPHKLVRVIIDDEVENG